MALACFPCLAGSLLALSAGLVGAQPLPDFIHAEHRAVLSRYLQQHPQFRVAADADCACDAELSEVRQGSDYFKPPRPDFHPYYVVGDLNDDGRPDFAIALVDTRLASDGPRPRLRLLAFHGPFGRSVSRPQRLAADFKPNNQPPLAPEVLLLQPASLNQGRRLPPTLVLGPSIFGSDDNWGLVYDWPRRRYVPLNLRPEH